MEFKKQNLKEKTELNEFKANLYLNVDSNDEYKQIVNLIRENYSLSNEIAILRKTIKIILDNLNIDNEEFDKYNSTVEYCKTLIEELRELEQ